MTTTAAAAIIEPQKVELVLAQLANLPALSPVVARILSLTSDPRANAKPVIELVETDPSLTARLLSLLNRADRGIRPEAITVANAVTLLGFNTIRHVAMSAKVLEVLGPAAGKADETGASFDRLEFWKHCLAVGCATRRIALALNRGIDAEEAFVWGLLHDLGKAALDATMPKSFAKIVKMCEQSRGDISDLERALLGVDHSVVGHRLAQRWGLPQRLIDCIWLHHQDPDALPASVAAQGHVQIVQLADTIVREQRIGYSGNHRSIQKSAALAARLGLSETARSAIVASLADEIETRAAWIGVDSINSRDVYLKAISSATDELAQANAALAAQNRGLSRKAEYFAALRYLNASVSPSKSVREVCGAAAEAIRQALDPGAVIVVVSGRDGRWEELGWSDGVVRTDLIEQPTVEGDRKREQDRAAKLAAAGTWIAPPGRSFEGIVDRFRGMLGDQPVWLMPVVRDRAWVAGAIFSADPDRIAELYEEAGELAALSSAAGLALAQALTQSAALALGEELAEANRRVAVSQAEALRARNLESIVALAAGAAHEMNNPLSVISGRAQMMRARTTNDEDRRTAEAITTAAQTCSDIVSDLMEFAQPRAPRPEPVDLASLLETMRIDLVRQGVLESAGLHAEIPSDTPKVLFDREQLTRTFAELLANAAAATDPARRVLTVKAMCDLADKRVVVSVRDNGTGMSPEVLERAMDPFFSHQPAGRRRGLGLARVHQWVRSNGGDVRIESQPGAGTTVELRLQTHVDVKR